jgi:hypothetical protein
MSEIYILYEASVTPPVYILLDSWEFSSSFTTSISSPWVGIGGGGGGGLPRFTLLLTVSGVGWLLSAVSLCCIHCLASSAQSTKTEMYQFF